VAIPDPATPGVASSSLDPRMGGLVGSPYAEQSTFRRGELLQKRFKVLRFIAKGGAGEVYEAQDLELRCPVALKVARPEVTGNENAMERFRREIALARQVTHPNVCRIFDIFRQEIPAVSRGGTPRETLFLTMELLNGESLASRIHRHGPLTPDEALPLIEDMVDGLKAAHRVGVIHRDFKSANVVLVEEADGTRAVITDFGLARGHMPDNSNPDITMSGTVVGTPNYMSPEQLTGGEISPHVDMYALGIVIYEMMTGTRPFRGETDLSTAVKRLTEAPASPRIHCPDMDAVWERAILRCLEREPEDRFPSLADLPKALKGELVTSQPPSIKRAQRKQLTWAAAIVAPLLIAAAIFFATLGAPGPGPVPATDVIDQAAVLDFHNLSGSPEHDWLTSAMAEMINGEIASGGGIRMMPREAVTALAKDLGMAGQQSLSAEAIAALRQETGTDLIVEGSYLVLPGGQLRLQLRAHKPDGTVTTVTEQGSEAEMFTVVDNATRRLRSSLDLGAKPVEDSSETAEP
jgi:TolB-like protein